MGGAAVPPASRVPAAQDSARFGSVQIWHMTKYLRDEISQRYSAVARADPQGRTETHRDSQIHRSSMLLAVMELLVARQKLTKTGGKWTKITFVYLRFMFFLHVPENTKGNQQWKP